MGAREARSTDHCQTGRTQAYVLFYAPAAPRLVLGCRAMKHYHSIRYAFVWCEQLASCDIKMGTPDSSMQSLYREYAAAAQYLGRVRKKSSWRETSSSPSNSPLGLKSSAAFLIQRASGQPSGWTQTM